MGEILRMIVVLSLICGLSGLTLASLRDATRERIVLQELTFVQGPAIEHVLGQSDNNPIADRKTFPAPGGGEVTVFPALRGGKLAGVALERFGKGFGGDLGVMVGFSMTDDTLTGIGITTMKETPGVGSRTTLPSFTAQFTGHKAANLALTKNGGDVDAVSGATISSTAAVDAVNQAVALFTALKGDFQTTWGGAQ
ncbi:MAG: RnfABCDGE type electron transport complex subunit G [Desulfovibrionaceae bacterium]